VWVYTVVNVTKIAGWKGKWARLLENEIDESVVFEILYYRV
jgi:hypothetical protein